MHLFGSARLLLESKLEYIISKYENLLMDDFLAYLADTVESHFIKTDLMVLLISHHKCRKHNVEQVSQFFVIEKTFIIQKVETFANNNRSFKK